MMDPYAKIELTSNGTLIDRGMAKELIRAGLDSIIISKDSLETNLFHPNVIRVELILPEGIDYRGKEEEPTKDQP